MRGFNDFNTAKEKENEKSREFPSPCGVLMILIFDSEGMVCDLDSFRPHAGF